MKVLIFKIIKPVLIYGHGRFSLTNPDKWIYFMNGMLGAFLGIIAEPIGIQMATSTDVSQIIMMLAITESNM